MRDFVYNLKSIDRTVEPFDDLPTNVDANSVIDSSKDCVNRVNGNLKYRSISKIKYLMIHHTGSSKLCFMDLVNLHTRTLHKWPTVGYHYYILKSGDVIKCNHPNVIVNGCLNFNSNTLHICFEGDYTSDDFNLNFDSIIDMIVKDLPSGIRFKDILCHCDKKNTRCPGSNLIKIVRNYRNGLVGKSMLIWPDL